MDLADYLYYGVSHKGSQNFALYLSTSYVVLTEVNGYGWMDVQAHYVIQ